ncbi:MAG: argininosuccinate synthase, partial [Patescibacteria group bacterium]
KVVLAFSGGLDTSFCVPYLIDKGFEVITAIINSGGFSDEELKNIEDKSKKLGAIKHYLIDAKQYFYDSTIQWIIKTNGLYEGSYPNCVSSQRYHLVEKIVEIAKKEKAKYIANGNSGMGSDQVRFNLTAKLLAPEISVIEPIKEMGGNRKKEIEFLKSKGFDQIGTHKKYSTNKSLMGITYSGSKIDDDNEPPESIFEWVTGKNINKNKYFKIEFKNGLPIKLDSQKIIGSELLSVLNIEIGSFGFGKGYYTGDVIVGIKGHIVFEAPGILFLIKAHLALEQYVLSKPQIYFGDLVSKEMTEYIYNGKFYDPYVDALKAFVNKQQKNVTGKVLMKLEYGNALPVSVKSKYSLIDQKIAMYAQSKSWTKEEVNGFIKLYGLQSVIASKVNKKGGDLYE